MKPCEIRPSGLLARREILLAGVSLSISACAVAQPTATVSTAPFRPLPARGKRGAAMTAAEEANAARAVAVSIADETGEPAHPAVAMSPRIRRNITLFDGTEYGEAQSRGKLLLVFYWASWCPVCKVVAPRLQEFWLRNRARGVEVLALSTDSSVQPAFAYVQRMGFTFPASMSNTAGLDSYMTPRVLPTLMVRSRRGVVVSVDEGEIEADEFQDYLVHL